MVSRWILLMVSRCQDLIYRFPPQKTIQIATQTITFLNASIITDVTGLGWVPCRTTYESCKINYNI
jgi:hypothetical protein